MTKNPRFRREETGQDSMTLFWGICRQENTIRDSCLRWLTSRFGIVFPQRKGVRYHEKDKSYHRLFNYTFSGPSFRWSRHTYQEEVVRVRETVQRVGWPTSVDTRLRSGTEDHSKKKGDHLNPLPLWSHKI